MSRVEELDIVSQMIQKDVLGKDELFYTMNRRKLTNFRMPAYKTIDHKEPIFHSAIREIEENPRVKVYHYLGIDLKYHR